VFPGHETTVVRMDFGVLYLLSDPARRDWLMAAPEERIDQTVDVVEPAPAENAEYHEKGDRAFNTPVPV